MAVTADLQPDRASGVSGLAVLVTIAFATSANAIGYLSARPVLPAIQQSLAHGPNDALLVKLVLPAFLVGLILGSALSSVALPRAPRAATMAGAAVVFALAGVASFLAAGLPVLLACRVVSGAAAGALNLVAIAVASEAPTAKARAGRVGLIAATSSIVAVAMSPLAGLIGSVDPEAPFLIQCLVLPTAALAFGLPAGNVPVDASEGERVPASPFPLGLLGVSLLVGTLMTLPNVYIVFRMHDIGVVRPGAIGLLFLSLSIPETLSGLLFGRLRTRITSSLIWLMGFVMVAGGLGTLAIATSVATFVVGLALQGAGINLLYASAVEQAASVSTRRAQAAAIMLGAFCAGSILGVFVIERLVGAATASAPLLGIAALSLVGALGAAARRQSQSPEQRSIR